MKRWLKIAVPVGIAVVLVSVMAIGFGSASIDAAPGGNGNGKAFGLDNGNGNSDGGGNGSLTITIAEGNPHFGTTVTFAVDGRIREKDLAKLAVTAKCYQNGTRVYRETVGVRDGLAGPFTLGPTSTWTGGGAECIAYVWLWPDVVTQLATMEFSVEE